MRSQGSYSARSETGIKIIITKKGESSNRRRMRLHRHPDGITHATPTHQLAYCIERRVRHEIGTPTSADAVALRGDGEAIGASLSILADLLAIGGEYSYLINQAIGAGYT